MDVQKLRSEAADRLHEAARDSKARADALVEGAAQALGEFAAALGPDTPLAGLAREAASTVEDWSAALRDKSVDALLDDGRALVRQSPGLAIGAAVVAGFVLTRFLKAGTPR